MREKGVAGDGASTLRLEEPKTQLEWRSKTEEGLTEEEDEAILLDIFNYQLDDSARVMLFKYN